LQYSVNLKTNLRQGNKEQELKDVLLAIREYKITPVQAKWLQKFQWQNLKSSYGQGLLTDMSEKGLFVFHDCASSSIKQTKRNTEICCQHDFCIFA
jgi:hypothetical protein